MTLSEFSIRRPVFAWMLMSGLIIFGAISLGRLGISQMPDIDFPVLDIRVTWEGAAPDVLEAELVDPIEQAVISVEGIHEIRSTIRQGSASVTLEFDIDRNIDAALQEVQASLSNLRLPLGVDMPVIRKSNPEDEPIMWIGLASERPMREVIRIADLMVVDRLLLIPGVGEIIYGGGFAERNLRVWVDNEKLRLYQLTILDVVNAVGTEHIEAAGGYIEGPETEFNIRTLGEGLSAEEVGQILITSRGGQPIYDTTIRIGDVARIEDGLSDVRRVGSINGMRGLGLGVKKQRGSNQVEVARLLRTEVERLSKELPADFYIQVNADFSTFVEDSVRFTQRELIFAAVLTTLICWLFLGNWTSAINIFLAIPTSILGTFIVIYFMGFTLNLFTLLALALAIGIVVDDAIMMLENITRHYQMGKDRVTAAMQGSRQIIFAAIATTVVLVAIFLPVAFMEGVIGLFFFQFGVTLSAAVLLSTVEALTLTPMRCSQFLAGDNKPGPVPRAVHSLVDWLCKTYSRMLATALGHPAKVLASIIIIVPCVLLLLRALPSEYVPPQDEGFFRIRLRTPVGSSLERSIEMTRPVEQWIREQPETARYLFSVGGGSGITNEGFVAVTLVPRAERPGVSQADIMQRARDDLRAIPDLSVQVPQVTIRGLSAGRSYTVAFNLRGPDYEKLAELTNEVTRRLEEQGLVDGLENNYRVGMPEVRIIPDRAAAALRGVSMDNIGRTINAALGGIRAGKFTNDGRRYDVRVRLEPEQRLTPESLNDLQVRTGFGELIPLADVVRLDIVPTVQTVSRFDRQRAVSIFGDAATGRSQGEVLEAVERICLEILPEGYTFFFEGEAEAFAQARRSLLLALGLAILLSYMVLASQFNSMVHPISILLAIVPAGLGALLGLWIFGGSLNLFSGIGLILLVGIVTKNSIMIVEFANRMRTERGLSVTEALLTAAPIRLRPVLMTSAATIAAAFPVFIGLGAGSESRSPMATVVIFGMALSTLVTLFITPCAYQLLSRIERARPGGENFEIPKDIDDTGTF